MSYTPPVGNAVQIQFDGAAYTPPVGSAVHFAPSEPTVSGLVSAPTPLGTPTALGGFAGVAVRYGHVSAPTMLGAPTGHAVLVSVARSSTPTVLCAPSARAAFVLVGRASAPSLLGAPGALATVLRYELRGEVRISGVLVDRRVRAYLRSSGALVAEVDTAAGRFNIPAGFAAAEHYVIPIDMAESATDFSPPVANRVTSVLAMDVA